MARCLAVAGVAKTTPSARIRLLSVTELPRCFSGKSDIAVLDLGTPVLVPTPPIDLGHGAPVGEGFELVSI